MQLLTADTSKAQRLFWSLALVAAVVGVLTIRQTDPVLVAAAVSVMIVGLAPFYIWLLGTREGLPIWPAFSLYSCSLAAMPALQKSVALERFSNGLVLQALLTMAGFFIVGTITWTSLTARAPKPPQTVLMLESGTAIRALLLCIFGGVLFQANLLAGWIHFPGNTMQVARGVASGLSFLGIFAMAYFHGRGLLKNGLVAIYLCLTFLLVCVSLTGLMIANVVQPLALALIGYILGKGRPPWAVLAVMFVLVAILHTGKYKMREIYVANPDGAPQITLASLPSFYGEWISYGLSELGGIGGVLRSQEKDDSPTTVFERAGNLHMLVLVQEQSPDKVPFLGGATYETIPQMLLPRFLMPNKAISHAGNILLSVNYGLVDIEGARNVSIGWSLIAEAYANFGYLGVFVLSILLSSGYAFVTRLSSGVPITSLRFVAGLVVLASVTNENTLGVFVPAQFQAVVGVALASYFLMRRQPNPFAAQGGSEGIRHTAEGAEHGVWSRGQGAVSPSLGSVEQTGGKQLAADGGVVRTLPIRTPERIASWMPRRMRAAVVAQYAAQEVGREEGEVKGRPINQESKRPKDVRERPRQVAVPYESYRRYRG